MKTTLPLLFAMLISFTANSQIISQFTWEANPVSKAAVGPDGLSYTAAATSSAYGTTGRGLNAGNTREEINLTLPGSYFDVSGIDIAIDFRREESEAYFFSRGSFLFGMANGGLTATYLVKNGASSTTITTGNVHNIPTDHLFHTYRFRYNNNTGIATLSVDGTNVYTTPAAAATLGQALSWSTGNVMIGYRMDGASTNVAILDNLLIQAIPPQATLPLKLLSFSAAAKGSYAAINWSTTQESNVAGFSIERSNDGVSFSPVKSVKATNSFSSTSRYQWVDSLPLSPVGYYRLKMTDIDGSFTYSEVRKVSLSASTVSVSCFPNPTTDYVNVRISSDKAASYVYTVASLDGKTLLSGTQKLNSGVQLVSLDLTKTATKGVLLVQVLNTSDNTTQSFKIVKQ